MKKKSWIVRDKFAFGNGKRYEPVADLGLRVESEYAAYEDIHLQVCRELEDGEKFSTLSYKEGMLRAKLLAAAPDLLEIVKTITMLENLDHKSCCCRSCEIIREASKIVRELEDVK